MLMVKKSYNVNECEVVLVYYLKFLFCWKLIHLLTVPLPNQRHLASLGMFGCDRTLRVTSN